MFKEYTKYDAIDLAELIRTKQVSAKEVLEAAIIKANDSSSTLNAIIHRFDQVAFDNIANLPSSDNGGVFAGVPFLLKDLGFQIAGQPLTMGSRSIRINSAEDSEMVARMKATGVNTFGLTNTPELGLIITTEPKAYGATHNPFKYGYSSGGSSGGSASAVSAGIVPMAGANDGGGSIRFPSAWCGVFGLKPSRGCNPQGMSHSVGMGTGEAWHGAVQSHVISRSVRDSALMLDMTAGFEKGSPTNLGSYLKNFEDFESSYYYASQTAPRQLRIAIHTKPLIANSQINSEVLSTLEETGRRLEQMGHIVDYADPVFDVETVWWDFMTMVCCHTAFDLEQIKQRYGKAQLDNIEPQTRNMAMIGNSLTAQDLLNAQQGWYQLKYNTDTLFEEYDLILCPTVPTPAVKHGELLKSSFDEFMMQTGSYLPVGRMLMNSNIAEKLSHQVMSKMAFTILGNMTGLPCMSVPLAMSQEGLPIGMQFIAPLNDESTLFSMAGELERAGWFTEPACDVE